jgi:predicted AAA+ superfamily ATPase
MRARNLYLQRIQPFMNRPIVKVVTGVRRSGKSTFLKLVMQEIQNAGALEQDVIFVSKELVEFDSIKTHLDLHKYVTEKIGEGYRKKYLFLDEPQEIENWEKAVNSLLAEGSVDIFITGSNSRMLSSELATLLTGRQIVIPMFPLSFKEFLDFRNATETKNLDEEFALFLKYGGLPGIHCLPFEDEIIFQFLNAVYNTVLVKDVVTRHSIRDVHQFERITNYIFDNCGNITTAKKISDFLRSQRQTASVDTVLNYISFLQEAHLIYKCPRYDITGKKLLELHEKYYATDLGIRHSVLGFRPNDISKTLENVVFLELLRRGYLVTTGKVNEYEVDFVADKNGTRIYIQVCYMLASQETEDREFRPLERINDNYPKMVLSMDRHWGTNRSGISRRHIIDFLLEAGTAL